jgi:basic membrane protein A and related proteins
LGGILKKTYKVVVAIAAASLLTSVAVAPANAATKQKVCVALDTAGINDKSFNQTSYEGAKAAKAAGYASTIEYLPAKSGADYVPNIQKFVDKKCTLIIGIGYLLGDAMKAAATKNPTIKFAIVDDPSGGANLKGIQYQTDESAFLVGYFAAAMSKTGKVATYGGIPIPPVTIWMDGYAYGVEYYNQVKNKNVTLLGWDVKTQTGKMLGGFDATTEALAASVGFEQQGADYIFAVAGGMQATTAANSLKTKKSNVVWVDATVMGTGPQYASVTPISATKGLKEGVLAVIKETYNGKFTNKAYLGTLKNKGVGYVITPAWSKKIPKSLQTELKDLAADVGAGIIPIK